MMNSSKRRRNNKAAAAGALLLAVMLATSACGGSNSGQANAGNETAGTATDGPIFTQLPEESGIHEPDIAGNESTEDSGSTNGSIENQADKNIINEGTYSGLSDSSSIEIVTAKGAIALQFTEDLKNNIDNIPDDAKVKFEYVEKSIEGEADLKQNWLTKIEEIK